mmetsp:Transcript_20796/g.48829  ORF Transcript_20796/g.48829 Transcript_20796/m.48829 type:complete len:206 (-) Transcript_20796:77-694(-)
MTRPASSSNLSMETTLLCAVVCAILFTRSLELIGFIYGPVNELLASERQREVAGQLSSLETDKWPWEGDQSILSAVYDQSYRNQGAATVRDAGEVAAIFAMILALIPNLTNRKYSIREKLLLLIMSSQVRAMSAMMGQIAFQRSVPVETLMIQRLGLFRGILTWQYCSVRSVAGFDGIDQHSQMLSFLNEGKVLGCALALAIAFL